jgi:ATP-dependent helicase YprA (DUF1998 family)
MGTAYRRPGTQEQQTMSTTYTYGAEYRSGEFSSRKDRSAALALVKTGGKPSSFLLSHPYGSAQYVRHGRDVVLTITSDDGRTYSTRRVSSIA